MLRLVALLVGSVWVRLGEMVVLTVQSARPLIPQNKIPLQTDCTELHVMIIPLLSVDLISGEVKTHGDISVITTGHLSNTPLG